MDAPVLLVAHGSRLPEAADEAERMRAAVERRRDGVVRLGHLELSPPLAVEVVDELVAEGVTELVVQPLLLLPGNHATFDIDAVARRAHDAGCAVRVGHALGSDVHLLTAAEQHVRDQGPADALLVIASSTASDRALRSLDASAALVSAGTGITAVVACPATLDGKAAIDALTGLAGEGHRRIVVLPWMLFPGRLEAATTGALSAGADRLGVELVVAERFGVAEGVIESLVRQIERAAAWPGQPRTNPDET